MSIYLARRIERKIEKCQSDTVRKVKRSFQYDLNNKFSQMTGMLSSTGHTVEELESVKEKMQVELPIFNDENFLTFDEHLKNDNEVKVAFVSIYYYSV